MFDEDIATAQSVVVKSRGHFRADCLWFSDVQTIEVDTGGLTSPVLTALPSATFRDQVFHLIGMLFGTMIKIW